MTKRCICEICTCGRHRCPHNNTDHLKHGRLEPCRATEYTKEYKAHPWAPTQNFKPQPVLTQSAPFEGATTNRADYTAKDPQRPYKHQGEPYVKPEGEFGGVSSYKVDYPEKHAPRTQAIRHEGPRQVMAKFQGDPTYSTDYRPWELQKTSAFAPKAMWAPPTDKFDGHTTMQDDFRSKEIPSRRNFKPVQGAKLSDEPFPDSTTNREAFVPHPLEKPFVRPKEEYQKPSQKFDGTTTARRDFQGQPGAPTQSCKPVGKPFQSDAKFEDDTTFRSAFKGAPGEKPYHHVPEPYQQPKGEFNHHTTNQDTYTQMPINRVLAKRPNTAKRNDAKFEGLTSYSNDFKAMRGERAQIPKGPDYVPNQNPFEGSSTYKTQYQPYAQAPPHSFRPSNAPMQSDARFDDTTMYKNDYVAKAIPYCEAARLDQPGARYRFDHLNSRGHKLYVETETIVPLNSRSPIQQNRGPVALSVA